MSGLEVTPASSSSIPLVTPLSRDYSAAREAGKCSPLVYGVGGRGWGGGRSKADLGKQFVVPVIVTDRGQVFL